MALHASPSNDCWNVAMSESFSPSNYNNFSNLPHIANNGFSRAEYGSSGAFSDVCALVPGMNNVHYFGLKVTLEAGYNYRLKWAGKSGGFAKSVQVHFGASTTSTEVVGNSHTMPLLNPSMPAPAFTSQSFTPPSNGQYYVLLKLAPGSIGSGSLRFDDLVLERSCSVIAPPAVFFTTQDAEAAEGGSVEICVGIQTPYIYHATQVQVAAAGPVQPHLASFSTQTLTFPAGSAQNRCFTFFIPANNEPDGDFSYRFVLQNPSSSGGNPYTAQPDTLILSVKDDILQNNCANWNPGTIYNLDTDMPGNWQHGAPSSLSTDWADYAGDYAYKTDYSTAAYIAIPFQLSPLFSYRLQWKGRAQNTAGPAIPEILLMRGTAPNSGVLMPVAQQADGAWGIYTGEAFEVATAGTYYLTIKGGGTFFNLKTDLYIDDIVLQRVCKTTSVAFSSITPQIVEGDEGALFRVCLDIITPSPHRATTVALAFNNETSPHFSSAPSPVLVTFPAGSSERQCVDIPSALWPGDDPRSQYSLHIQSVTGGIYPVVGPDTERTLRVRDANTCWSTVQQQNFSAADQNLSNVSGWVANNGAARSGYGATGQEFDYCAAMTMTPGSYAGFQQWLESGKQYRVRWNLKVDAKKPASVFLSLGTQAGIGNKVGVAVSIAPSGNQQPGIEFTSEYFTVPANGNYFLLLNAESGANPIVRFDDFRLEARCPDTEVFFQQSLVETAEGNALLVCVQIANPSPSSPTTVEVSFEGLQSPHFNGVPATRTVTFPAGSSTPQCLLFPTTANGQYDGGAVEYILRLQNITGNGARIAQPDRATLRVLDDVSLENCFWAGPDRQICLGQSTQLGLPGAAMPAHCSAAPFCFRWEPASLILNGGQYDARPFVAPQQDTWFVIYMTDGHGNLHSDSVLVQVTASLQASITGHETPVCSGGARTLQVQTSGGAGSLSYQWQHSMDGGASWAVIAGVTGSVYTSPFLSASRMYRVAAGSSGCGSVVTAPATVQVLPDPSLSISASAASVCLGGFSLLSASPANGTGACTTQWQSSSSASGPWNNIAGATGNSLAPSTLVPGIRYFRASYTCSGGGCDVAFSNVVSVTVVPGPSISTQPAGATICSGSTRTLDVAATGGTPALSYQWQSSPNGTTWSTHFGDTQSSLTTPPLTSNTYYRVAVSASGSGCDTVYSQAALVQVIALPDWSIAPAQAVLCPDTSLILSVPDAQGVSFLWPDGSTAPQWEVQQPGAYSVVLTHNIYGCSDTLSTNVSAAPVWTQSIEASSDFLCDEVRDIKLNVNGTSGGSYSYAWSGGSLTEQQILTTTGVYYLTLTDDATGCSTVLSRVVQNSDSDIALRIEAPHTLLCRDGEMTLRAVLDGLHESLRERVRLEWWHDGSEQVTTDIRTPDRYGVTAFFGEHCRQETMIEILQAPDLEVRIQSPEGTKHACPESPLLLQAVVSDSTLVAAYHWSGGADTPEAVFTESGPYTLLVTDVNGCVWEDRFDVKSCPTIVFFDTLRVQVKAEETAELCLRLINPSQENATTVEVVIEGSPAPYFGEAEALRSVEFAPGETRQCLSYLPPRVEEADSITLYTLRLQNAAGGHQAAIGEARQAELLIEAGIRCRVQQDSAAVNCALTDTTSIHNGVPLISTLKKDDSFWAGDFEVKVTQANGNGTFNGKGIITVPYLQQAQINVILKDVRVNEECQMVAGEVKVEGVGAAILSEELANALNDLLGTLDGIDNVLGHLQNAMNVISTVVNSSSAVSSVLGSNWNVLQGAGPIYNEYPYLPDSLAQHINNAVLCYLTNPPDVCNQVLAGNIQQIIQAIQDLFEADYAVRFLPYSPTTFGFDTLAYQAMHEKYNFFQIAGERYFAPWASVAVQAGDTVTINIPHDQLPEDLSFEDNRRNPVEMIVQDNKVLLPIRGAAEEGVHQLYAVQLKTDSSGNPVKKYAGKLNILTYPRKTIRVELVPVNQSVVVTDSLRSRARRALQVVYEPAVVQIEVSAGEHLSLPSLGESLDTTGTGIFAAYNPEMRALTEAVKNRSGFSNETYYIMLVTQFDDAAQLGFMPKGRKFGFVALQPHSDEAQLIRTIAHELGHGTAVLNHTWEDFTSLPSGQTDNLMDYGSGTRLHKYQWERIQHPPLHLAQLDEEEEGAGFVISKYFENAALHYEHSDAAPDAKKTYFTPAGDLFTLPARAVCAFLKSASNASRWPAGCLIGFVIDGKVYSAYWYKNTEKFTGYKNNVNEPYYPNLTPDATNNVVEVHAAKLDACTAQLLRGTFSGFDVWTQSNEGKSISTGLPLDQMDAIATSIWYSPLCSHQEWLAQNEACRLHYQGHPYLAPGANDPVSRYVKANPCVLNSLGWYDFKAPLPFGDSTYQQLGDQVGFALGLLTVGIVAAPVVLASIFEAGVPASTAAVTTFELRRRAVDASTAWALDVAVQASLNYFWPSPEEEIDRIEAFRRVHWPSSMLTAAEAAIHFNGYESEIAAISNCVAGGFWNESGQLRDEFSWQSCFYSSAAAVITHGILNVDPHKLPLFKKFPTALARLKALPKPALVRGYRRLLTQFPSAAGSLDLWALHRFLKTNLNKDDIAALFDLPANAPELSAIAQNLNFPHNAQVHTVLGEGNWWYQLSKTFPDNPLKRAQLLQDISGNANFAGALKARPELVGAWERMISAPTSRVDIPILSSVSIAINRGIKGCNSKCRIRQPLLIAYGRGLSYHFYKRLVI